MRWFKIGIAGLVAAVVLLTFFGVPANFVVGAVTSRIEAQTGYRLRLGGETTLSFWPRPTISLHDVSLLTVDPAGAEDRFKAESIRIVLALRDLWHGQAHVVELAIAHPTLRLPLPRERLAPAPFVASPPQTSDGQPQPLMVDHVAVNDGTVVFYGRSGRDEGQFERANLEISHVPGAAGLSLTGSFYSGSQVFNIDMESRALPQRFEEQAIPVELTLRAPGLLADPFIVSAELRSRAKELAINTISGKFGRSNFDGWAKVDFSASKPQVKAFLDVDKFQVLMPAADQAARPPAALSEPWSDQKYDFDALNFFDARMRLSIADFAVGAFRVAPVALEANIDGGVLRAKFANIALYGGTADGTISLDASHAVPAQALNVSLAHVSALPLLTDVAGFDSLEGTMSASVAVQSAGASEQAAMSALGGTVDVRLADGAVRGIDLTKIMHNIADTILNGWQWNANDKTPLTDFTAHFSLANGVATTDNLNLTGPVVTMTGTGSIDIAAKTLQMKFNPRVVTARQDTPNANGASGADQGGIGIPVLVEGSWSEPKISPDVSGLLNNPGAALNQLQSVGKNFFGDSGSGSGNGTGGGSNDSFGNILNGIGGLLKGSGSYGGAGNYGGGSH